METTYFQLHPSSHFRRKIPKCCLVAVSKSVHQVHHLSPSNLHNDARKRLTIPSTLGNSSKAGKWYSLRPIFPRSVRFRFVSYCPLIFSSPNPRSQLFTNLSVLFLLPFLFPYSSSLSLFHVLSLSLSSAKKINKSRKSWKKKS